MRYITKLGEWNVKFCFIEPLSKGKHWCYKFLFNFILFTINITDFYGSIIVCNIHVRWDNYFKSLPGGGSFEYKPDTILKMRKNTKD